MSDVEEADKGDGAERRSMVMSEDEKNTAYHEGGQYCGTKRKSI